MFLEKKIILQKNNCILVGIIFFVSISSLLSQTPQPIAWKLKKFQNGISIYTQDAENSKFKELKSVTTIKTSLSSIVAVLNDWAAYPEWVYKCEKSSTLKKISDREVIHYQNIVAPWPVDNRDFVVNVKLEQNAKTKVITIHSASIPDYIPKILNHVRIKEFKASWTLVPLQNGSVEVTYQLLVNPGGDIPAWLVNMAVIDGPFETCSNLKERVLMEKYQKKIVSYIEELNGL